MSDRIDVVVVGAGVAGLAAGAKLVGAGMRVLILEARDRIGGRILTAVDPDEPVAIELGAEFLHGKFDTGRLTVEDVPGERRSSKVIDRFVHDVERHRSAASVGERIEAFDATAEDRLRVRTYVEGFHAADPERFSPRAFVQEETGTQGMLARIPSGYVGVANHLAKPLEGMIRTEVDVRSIRHRPRSVTAVTNAGEFEARAAIVTVPLPLLQQFDFDPPLPLHHEAARSLAMGNVARVVLQFDRRRWPEDLGFIHSLDTPFSAFWTSRPRESGLIVAWAGGPRADRLLAEPKARRYEHAVASFERALGEHLGEPAVVAPHLTDAHHHDWLVDEWSRGAYSWVPTGAEEAKSVLSTPFESTIFLAGEAVHLGPGAGTVHGAVESGERAARAVLERVSR